jgi:hypothetical protein
VSEITITIPLSLLEGMEDFTPQGISKAFQATQDLEQRTKQRDKAKKDLLDFANALTQVLDRDMNEYQKFRDLRELATTVRHYAERIQTIP